MRLTAKQKDLALQALQHAHAAGSMDSATALLALELLLLCFGVSVLVQLYLQVNPGNFTAVSTITALLVLSLDWLFFYYMPGYTGAALRYVTFVLPSAVLTIPAALLAFWLVQRIHDGFRIDNGVV